ncbi:MAG TPA: hypothetical protein DD628_02300 [Clostridiales bacterium]|nr:hypothetical protein [Candidatus Apopatosoma intestinale]
MSNHCTIYAEMHMIFDNDFDVHSIEKQLGIAPTECKSRNETRISPLTNNPTLNSRVRKKSSPMRGTWIEIETPEESRNPFCGRPPCGDVDSGSKQTRQFEFYNYSSIITQDCYQFLFFR